MATLPADESADRSVRLARLRVGMGTLVAMEAEAADARTAAAGIAAAHAAISRVEALMHPTRPGADLAALNAAPPGVRVRVDPWTDAVLRASQRLHELSGGAFDPCLPEPGGRCRDLDLSSPLTVVKRAPLRIDLGGIAKGYAVDRALDALRAAGCHAGLVNAGGDVAAFGARTHALVVRTHSGCARVRLRDAALATSDATCAAPPAEHRGHYRRTPIGGLEAGPVAAGAVCVSAADAATADALTKCLLCAPPEWHPRILAACGARAVRLVLAS